MMLGCKIYHCWMRNFVEGKHGGHDNEFRVKTKIRHCFAQFTATFGGLKLPCNCAQKCFPLGGYRLEAGKTLLYFLKDSSGINKLKFNIFRHRSMTTIASRMARITMTNVY